MEPTSRWRESETWRHSGRGNRASQQQRPTNSSPLVRRLDEPDRFVLHTLLGTEPGYSIFLAANLCNFSLDATFVRYWGAFDGRQLTSTLMMVGRRAALYAPPGVDVQPLARTAAVLGADFSMGRSDLVDALLAASDSQGLVRREEHYLAEIAPTHEGALPGVVVPGGAMVRRATALDLEPLTQLYLGTDGFEQLSEDQVRRTMAGRVHSLRTYVAEIDGHIVAGASTSAETPDAAMIGGVWTAPDMRNRGFSTAVVAALARELLEEQRHPYLFYLVDNVTAAHVYNRVGFHVVGPWSIAYLTGDAP
ncbi:MAG: GNAT family N-acetyltransferase [Ktedonobacterales bacterium]